MPIFNIERWDAVITDKNTLPYPMLYIKPDNVEEFVKYIKENEFLFVAHVQDSDSDYDSMPVVASVNSSGTYPNFRPLFFNETGYYTITLTANWVGYPPKLGKVLLRGAKGPDKVEDRAVPFRVPTPMNWDLITSPLVIPVGSGSVEGYKDSPPVILPSPPTCGSMTNNQSIWILLSVAVVFVGLFAVSMKRI